MIAARDSGAALAAPAHPFFGRRAVIASKHGKERALYAPLREELGLFPEVLLLETDRFGTFTGEVPRAGSQLDALRAKLREAADATPYDAVIVASEGSFFPDPAFAHATLNRELVALYDPQREIEIVGSAVGPARHVGAFDVATADDLDAALARLGVPAHGIVVFDGARHYKGVRDRAALLRLVADCRSRGANVRIESDLRAHMHPTRMEQITAAALDAAKRARSRCPHCSRPGYWRTDFIAGLPCSTCGEATSRTRSEVWSCIGCSKREERASIIASADPADCTTCNP